VNYLIFAEDSYPSFLQIIWWWDIFPDKKNVGIVQTAGQHLTGRLLHRVQQQQVRPYNSLHHV
jgi:hypothetical protein